MSYERWKSLKLSCGHRCYCAESRYSHEKNMAYWERLNAEANETPLVMPPELVLHAQKMAKRAEESRMRATPPEEQAWLDQQVEQPQVEQPQEQEVPEYLYVK